ncbi:MAG TPA: hypothetical protein VGQ20_13860 [Acidimicrobiales bacterium]|nr:hypothetical protein [Acidimicrobiales bacterium]
MIRRPVIVDAEAWLVRRRVGPTSWCVVEELAARAVASMAGPVAAGNARELSVALGVSKDAVCRALLRLRAAELAEFRVGERRGGRFTAGGYGVDLDAAGLRVAQSQSRAPGRESTRRGVPQEGLF